MCHFVERVPCSADLPVGEKAKSLLVVTSHSLLQRHRLSEGIERLCMNCSLLYHCRSEGTVKQIGLALKSMIKHAQIAEYLSTSFVFLFCTSTQVE